MIERQVKKLGNEGPPGTNIFLMGGDNESTLERSGPFRACLLFIIIIIFTIS